MSGKAVTAPKGRATRARNEAVGGRSFFGPTLQWVLVIVATLAVLGAIYYFAGDVRSDLGGGGGHSGAPADVPAVVLDAAVG